MTSNKDKSRYYVVLAMAPIIIISVYSFGLPALRMLFVAVIASVVVDFLFRYLFESENKRLVNPSSIISGLILALILPSTTPLLIVIFGIFLLFLIRYTLLKSTLKFRLNPALFSRLILILIFPALLTSYVFPMNPFFSEPIDTITSATSIKPVKIVMNEPTRLSKGDKLFFKTLFFGNFFTNWKQDPTHPFPITPFGVLAEVSSLAALLGGLFLIYKKIINWRIPVYYLSTVFILARIFQNFENAVFYLLTGGIVFAAFFIATDYFSAPKTRFGMVSFAIGCGVLTVFFRLTDQYAASVSYAILIMNLFAPYFDKLYSHLRKHVF